MKRLVSLILAVFVTTFAQVQPVTLSVPQRTCPCCPGDNSCGMPGCLPPVSARTVPTAEQPAGICMARTRRATEPVRRTAESFYSAYVKTAAVTVATRAPDRVTLPASVPLFAAHCSFLI